MPVIFLGSTSSNPALSTVGVVGGRGGDFSICCLTVTVQFKGLVDHVRMCALIRGRGIALNLFFYV